MTAVHRIGDLRSCGATTVPLAPKKVFVNGQMISTTGDLNTHGGGALTGGVRRVFAGGLSVVGVGDLGAGDPVPDHVVSNAATGSPTVYIG